MIANLMMYKRPELADAHEHYWQLIRGHLKAAGIASPAMLSQDQEEFSVWRDPQLFLSQTCGMPYRKFLHGEVNLVGTPDFALEGCAPGYYRSAVITHIDDKRSDLQAFKDDVFAFNQTISQSGYAAMHAQTTEQGFWFEKQLQTHSHLESARAVAEKRAAIAAVDAVSWRLITQFESFASKLKVLEWTKPTPGLPYITSIRQNPTPIFKAVKKAIADLAPDTRQALGIVNLIEIPAADYLEVANPPD